MDAQVQNGGLILSDLQEAPPIDASWQRETSQDDFAALFDDLSTVIGTVLAETHWQTDINEVKEQCARGDETYIDMLCA